MEWPNLHKPTLEQKPCSAELTGRLVWEGVAPTRREPWLSYSRA
jgi:hypothetical protein